MIKNLSKSKTCINTFLATRQTAHHIAVDDDDYDNDGDNIDDDDDEDDDGVNIDDDDDNDDTNFNLKTHLVAVLNRPLSSPEQN